MIFRKSGKKIVYLLLHYPSGHWDFVKGNVEKSESDKETIAREAKEETGLGVEVLDGFREHITYFYRREGKSVFKEVVFYIAKAKSAKVKLSYEHQGFKWLPFLETKELITFKNSKNVLEHAHKFLSLKRNLKDFL